jgi:hypothetical protein
MVPLFVGPHPCEFSNLIQTFCSLILHTIQRSFRNGLQVIVVTTEHRSVLDIHGRTVGEESNKGILYCSRLPGSEPG